MQGTHGLVAMATQANSLLWLLFQPNQSPVFVMMTQKGGGINRHISPQTVDLKLTSRTDNSETNQKDVNYTLLDVERAHTLASVGVRQRHTV